jgi:hypothetical protein
MDVFSQPQLLFSQNFEKLANVIISSSLDEFKICTAKFFMQLHPHFLSRLSCAEKLTGRPIKFEIMTIKNGGLNFH